MLTCFDASVFLSGFEGKFIELGKRRIITLFQTRLIVTERARVILTSSV